MTTDSSSSSPDAIDRVEEEISALGERIQALAEAPAESVAPQPQPHEVFAQKLREAQSTWVTLGA